MNTLVNLTQHTVQDHLQPYPHAQYLFSLTDSPPAAHNAPEHDEQISPPAQAEPTKDKVEKRKTSDTTRTALRSRKLQYVLRNLVQYYVEIYSGNRPLKSVGYDLFSRSLREQLKASQNIPTPETYILNSFHVRLAHKFSKETYIFGTVRTRQGIHPFTGTVMFIKQKPQLTHMSIL